MVILLLGLLSVSSIYFVRLFSEKKMKMASLAIGVLYTTIVAWTYALFVFDAASLGFNGGETWRSIMIGSDIYRSLLDLTDTMSVFPDPVLHAITYVSLIIFLFALLVIIHGTYSVAQAAIKQAKNVHIDRTCARHLRVTLPRIINKNTQIFRLNCRMNC